MKGRCTLVNALFLAVQAVQSKPIASYDRIWVPECEQGGRLLLLKRHIRLSLLLGRNMEKLLHLEVLPEDDKARHCLHTMTLFRNFNLNLMRLDCQQSTKRRFKPEVKNCKIQPINYATSGCAI